MRLKGSAYALGSLHRAACRAGQNARVLGQTLVKPFANVASLLFAVAS